MKRKNLAVLALIICFPLLYVMWAEAKKSYV